MINGGKLLKLGAVLVPSTMVLAGCGAYVLYSTDGTCGEIVAADPNPELVWHNASGDVSGDATRFTVDLRWQVSDTPEGAQVFTGATQHLPLEAYFAALSEAVIETPFDLATNEHLVLQSSTSVQMGSLNASNEYLATIDAFSTFDYLSDGEVSDAVDTSILTSTGLEGVLFGTFLHLPVAIVASCDFDFSDLEYYDSWSGGDASRWSNPKI